MDIQKHKIKEIEGIDLTESITREKENLVKNLGPRFVGLLKINNLSTILDELPKPDTNWRENLFRLFEAGNMSPTDCCKMVGISWFQVCAIARNEKDSGNSELEIKLKEAQRAWAEYLMYNPNEYAGNAQLLMFLAKSRAGWSDTPNNEFDIPNETELELLKKAREELDLKIKESDKEIGRNT